MPIPPLGNNDDAVSSILKSRGTIRLVFYILYPQRANFLETGL